MIKLLIFGPTGSMGKLISRLAIEDDEIEVVAACDVQNIGEELGLIAGVRDPSRIKISNVENLQQVIKETKPEVAVDFTVASATEKNCLLCAKNGIKCVIGTTALSTEFLNEFESVVKTNSVPAVIAPNMSIGVNVLYKAVEFLTKYLSDWDIEIIEVHHHRKIDAPSGTALKIGTVISETLNVPLDEIAKFGRSKGPNKRLVGAKKELGFHSVRAGDIVGDHVILFAGSGERIEIKHQAQSRICFASGAIKAIKFISKREKPRIFSMNDVLGLKVNTRLFRIK